MLTSPVTAAKFTFALLPLTIILPVLPIDRVFASSIRPSPETISVPSTEMLLKLQLYLSIVIVLPLATTRSVVPSATTLIVQVKLALGLLKMSAEMENVTLPWPIPMRLSVVLSKESMAALVVLAVSQSSV